MKRLILVTMLFAAAAMIASAETMSASSSGSGSKADAMMAPADTMSGAPSMKGSTDAMMAPADTMSGAPSMKGSTDAMMAEPNSMKGSSDSMMEDMSYDTLKKEGRLVDVKTGMQLRMAKSSGMKVSYKNLMAAQAMAGKNPTVLFFSADWCPYCLEDLKDINANGARLGKVNVVVVDFDKSADLKKKYGITTQDTYVQIGPMGEKLAIWTGGGVDGILENVKAGM